jgi:acyl-coenzyme A thioesterase PaaI-like protein
MPRWVVNDGPEHHCFGCGHRNEHGLKLRFRVDDENGIEAEYVAPEHQAGAPGVVHGGIQAALLDEVMGVAIHEGSGVGDDLRVVTAEFNLRYRRPAPTQQPLRIRGRLERSEGRDYFARGEILSADGEVLTRADARWRRIAPPG